MSAELIVRPEVKPMSWQQFRLSHAAGSIALDGYVAEGPKFDVEGPYLNVNHHEEVNRLATLSTAQQLLMQLRMGMDKAFTHNGEFEADVYVNDCDQDVCAAWYLLSHIEEARESFNPMLNRFIGVAGTLDVTAGAFPYDRNLEILSELAWIFQPYNNFRASGEISKRDSGQFREVIDQVGLRIGDHLIGQGQRLELDARYNKLGGKDNWALIEEVGSDGRVGALIDGYDAYVTVQQVADGIWRYSVGRRSEFIPFDVPALLDEFNQAEGCQEHTWGGADTIGGSPRVGDSKLQPSEVEKIINNYLARHSR